jgi:hypothetical protein
MGGISSGVREARERLEMRRLMVSLTSLRAFSEALEGVRVCFCFRA